MTTERICIAYPYNGPVAEEFMWSLVQLVVVEITHEDRLLGSFYKARGSNIADNRNRICAHFLDNTNDTWLLMVDTDMEFEPDAPRRLWQGIQSYPDKNILIIGAAALLENGSCVFYAKSDTPGIYNSPTEIDNTIYELDAVGTGMILIHRRVLHEMRLKFVGPWHWFGHDQEGETMLGTDFTFCRRAASRGFKSYGHGGVRLNHMKTLPVPWGDVDA